MDLAEISAGELLGELALLAGAKRSAAARAETRVEAGFVHRSDFISICSALDPASLALLRRLAGSAASRIVRTSEQLAELLAVPARPAGPPVEPEPVGAPAESNASFDCSRVLRQLPGFCRFAPGELHQLVEACRAWTLPKGRRILRAGDQSDSCFVVVRGAVEVVIGPEAAPVSLAVLGPGAFFGQLGLLLGEPRSASCRVREPAVILELPRADAERLLQPSGHIGFRLTEALALQLLSSLGRANRALARVQQQQVAGIEAVSRECSSRVQCDSGAAGE